MFAERLVDAAYRFFPETAGREARKHDSEDFAMKRRVLLAWVVATTAVVGAAGCKGGDGEKAGGGMPEPQREALTGEPIPNEKRAALGRVFY